MLTTIIATSGFLARKYVDKDEKSKKKIKTGLAVLLNISVSIAIILTNKWLYTVVGFPNMTLTLMHFMTTFICLHVCQAFGVFSVKKVPMTSMIPLALCFCGFVVVTNLSLENNSVGTYQVAKVMTTPCVLLIQYYCYGKFASKATILTVIPIIIGVVLCFIYDIKFNLIGTVYAIMGVVVTSFYQVLVGEKQKELQLNSMQLLYYQAPMSAVILILPVATCEPVLELAYRSWTFMELVPVVCSCLIAFTVNLSIYWIIGSTSALTYNMAGHLKFCLTVAAGFFLFQDPMSANQLFGLILTLAGVVAYSHVRS
ncbi:solute carrier family 35 member E3 [Daphnia magna]|uniref:solute carrier family 35 member E3 n=1 Tax=Daphnia magna TaxID=35525 RepID=UPI001E1BAA79|nr:solute carrier family 35 member E3 [Daphnia magna]